MSTILKALRRLEEDGPTTGTATDFTNPADPLAGTGPLVADELRDRILAEEHAAEAGAGAQRNPDTKRRIAIGAAALVLMLVLGSGIYSSMSDETVAPTEPEKIALATALPSTPSPAPTPRPAPPTARVREAAPIDDPASVAAAAKSVSLHATVSPLTASPPAETPAVVPIPPVTIPQSAAASVAPSPKAAFDSPTATSKPGARKTPARSVAAKPSPPPKADDPLAIAAVTPTEAARAVDSQRTIATSEASRSKPATPRSRPKPTNVERRTPSVSAALPKRVPEERPGTSRPSTSPSPRQSEFAFRPHFPDLAVVRTAWHPDAARRSAKIRLEDTNEVLTLREGDAVGGLVVQEISPSAVVFKAGDVEIRRRVGRAGSSD
jgi:hypothetical protein